MPVNTVADNDVLTASFWNANVRDQVVSTVTSGTRPGGTEGQIIYETDTDRLMIYNGGWKQIGAASSTGANSWTPTITQSGNVTFTTTYAVYYRIMGLVYCTCSLAITGTGTSNNQVNISTPVTAPLSGLALASAGQLIDASVPNRYPFAASLVSTTSFRLIDNTQATNAAYLGQSASAFGAALASGDSITFSAWMEEA